MNEGQKAMKKLVLWHKVFAITFIVFVAVSSVLGIEIVNQVRAFNQCAAVEDSEFQACYDKALNR